MATPGAAGEDGRTLRKSYLGYGQRGLPTDTLRQR